MDETTFINALLTALLVAVPILLYLIKTDRSVQRELGELRAGNVNKKDLDEHGRQLKEDLAQLLEDRDKRLELQLQALESRIALQIAQALAPRNPLDDSPPSARGKEAGG